MIRMSNVCAGYGGEEVLHNINLTLEPGKVTILVGPNGCGKSTLFKALTRLNPHTHGEIMVSGTSIQELDARTLAKSIAYLPQGKNVPEITVKRMVLHGRFAYLDYPRRYRKQDYEIAQKAMEQMGIADLADKNVSQLSGGTQQKVYIAMALAQDTPTILMDEPTVYLDIAHQMKLMETAKELAAQGKAVVMVLHDLTQAFHIADKIVVMSKGEIVTQGIPEEIYQSEVINTTFQIRLERISTEAGYQYFYE